VMGDDTSIGIGDSAERIEFDGAGDISVLGANLGIGTTSPGTGTGNVGFDTGGLEIARDGNPELILYRETSGTYASAKMSVVSDSGRFLKIEGKDGGTGIQDMVNINLANGNVELGSAQYVKNNKSYFIHSSLNSNIGTQGNSNDKFKAPCDCKISAHGMMKVIGVVSGGAYNQLEVWIDGTQYTNNYGDSQTLNTWVTRSTSEKTFDANDEVNIWAQSAYGPSYGAYLTLVIEITPL